MFQFLGRCFSPTASAYVFFCLAALLLEAQSATAQINPDSTLEAEQSVVLSNVLIDAELADVIEGGATRGRNLFHSFSEFNVGEGQRVYFANPADIDTIMSRITGNNPSNISGRLGVTGSADLFLLNPNGLVFGANAELDIAGSFYGTTAEAIAFESGIFSAVDPAASSLLSMRPSVYFWNYLTDNSGDIVARGRLSSGGEMVLAGTSLDLQAQLEAGGDLSLLAADTLQIRDTAERPFTASAGQNLLIQGDEQIDIAALAHPDSGLFSAEDMTLRSSERIQGDAHYWSGRHFSVENLENALGDLSGASHPIIHAQGDVSLSTYEGASLQIFAGGSVGIGTITITGPAQANSAIASTPSSSSYTNVTLSEGTEIAVDGSDRPTLDIRAGSRSAASPSGASSSLSHAADTHISIGDIRIDAENGLVLLTNQYDPNLALSAGSLSITGDGLYQIGIDVKGVDNRQGGEVYLDSRQNIDVIDSEIATVGAGDVGDIVLIAGDTVTFNSSQSDRSTGAFSGLDIGAVGTGGDIRIVARNLNLINGAVIGASTGGVGDAGNVAISIEESVNLQGISAAFANQADISEVTSGVFSIVRDTGEGQSGTIQISARDLNVLSGARISTNSFGVGDAGSIRLNVQETARIEGVDPIDRSASGVFSNIRTTGRGDGGNVDITARNLQVLGGARLSTSTFGIGDAGSVILNIQETARFEGRVPGFNTLISSATSRVAATGQGEGGNVQISARDLEVLNGARLTTSTFGIGDAGSIILDIQETARFEGSFPTNISDEIEDLEGSGLENLVSGAFSRIDRRGEGKGGNVQLNAQNLELLNGAALNAATFGIGDAGSVSVAVEENIRIEGTDPDGSPSGVFSSVASQGVGQGGDIAIQANNLYLIDGGVVSATSEGRGDAGSVSLRLDNRLEALDGTVSTSAAFDSGGQLQITANNILLSGNSDIETFVNSGENNSGNITVIANTLIALDDSDILAFAVDGRGGDIDLSRTTYFGENAFEQDTLAEGTLELDTLEGENHQSDTASSPSRLDGNGRTDVDATGGIASGQIAVNDSAFIENGLSELSANLDEFRGFVSNRCIAQRTQSDRSFVITHRDGLPQQPGTSQPRYSLGEIRTQPRPESYPPIAEPQAIYQLADGRLILGRACEQASAPLLPATNQQ